MRKNNKLRGNVIKTSKHLQNPIPNPSILMLRFSDWDFEVRGESIVTELASLKPNHSILRELASQEWRFGKGGIGPTPKEPSLPSPFTNTILCRNTLVSFLFVGPEPRLVDRVRSQISPLNLLQRGKGFNSLSMVRL